MAQKHWIFSNSFTPKYLISKPYITLNVAHCTVFKGRSVFGYLFELLEKQHPNSVAFSSRAFRFSLASGETAASIPFILQKTVVLFKVY